MAIPAIQGLAGITAEPDLKYTNSNKAVLNIRFAFNDRRFNEQTNQWEDTKTFYVDGTAWEDTATRLADQLRMGDQVYVEGRLETEQWEQDGQKRSKPKLNVRTVRKLERNKPQQQGQPFGSSGQFNQQAPPPAGNQQASAFGQMTSNDPWAGSQQGEAPPF